MFNQKLGNRLTMVAGMVREGVAVADIGTDHAYLPAYLILNGISKHITASDVRPGPLENAKETVDIYSLNDRITLRLSDGLKNIQSSEAEDIIISGMGGTLITEILDGIQWIKDKSKRLILQPMSHAERLREFLCENEFKIIEETTCVDSGRIYIAMCAQYCGEKQHKKAAYYYIGELLNNSDSITLKYINAQMKHIKKRADSLTKADINPEEATYLYEIYSDIIKMCEVMPYHDV